MTGIAEARYLQIGGIDQWVEIRGADIANPPLILLHGGPGLTETAMFRSCNSALETHFTVVYWDQRGAGKSYSRDIPRSSMTVERFIADLDELVGAVCMRLRQPKVVLFGHSWGSGLGVLYAARFPAKVAAYVGSGQYGDAAAAEQASYAFALAEAQRLGKTRILARLRDIGPPPYTTDKLLIERTCVRRLEGGMRPRALWELARVVLGAPGASIFELPRTLRGFRFSLDAMWPEASRLNLIERVPELTMPVFLFLGRNDHWVPPETSVAYFDVLRAPAKQLVWFEASGHEPFVDEPAKFNAMMVERVLPAIAPREPAMLVVPTVTL